MLLTCINFIAVDYFLEIFVFTSRDFMSSFSQSARHFLYSSFLGAGSFQIPIPLDLRHDPTSNHRAVITRHFELNLYLLL